MFVCDAKELTMVHYWVNERNVTAANRRSECGSNQSFYLFELFSVFYLPTCPTQSGLHDEDQIHHAREHVLGTVHSEFQIR
jgi:hypothetical protein